MIQISAFADEIAADPREQVAVLQAEQIRWIDLRSAWNVNVLDLSDQQVAALQKVLHEAGIGVAAIASPLGKVSVESAADVQMDRLARAIELALAFGTRYIRVFSFYPPEHATGWSAQLRERVIDHLRVMTELARQSDIVLLHENEKEIYGDTIDRNVDILRSVNDPHFRSVLDPANYLQCTQEPYPTAYELTRPWLEYVHVKDVKPDGTLCVAGEGAARWPDLLRRLAADGYDGFLTLEPHLVAAGQYQGFSGPALFRQAAHALQGLLKEMDWAYA
jgi:Sugar phosphate isomerases/epimerases